MSLVNPPGSYEFCGSSYRKNQERASKFGSVFGRDRGLVNNCSAAAGRASNWTGHALNSSYFEVFQDTWRSNKENASACWNAAVSCPFMASNYVNFGLPRKQKIAVNKFWVRESEIGEECRQFWTWILGVNFFGGLKPWKNKVEKFAIKIRHQNSLRNSPAIFLKFAGPK